MPLFQNSVLNKYLKGLESENVDKAYLKFTSHFHNKTIQENIRNSKEEQYQGEFLIDLFVNVFGYIKNPTPNFNLTTELKNIKGSKKTDGAILSRDKTNSSRDFSPLAKAVIELKGTNTTDLSKVETQAFGYKNNQPGCNYVITSNFEKLRFYIDNAVDFEEFNLFQLTRERFNILWLCLSSEYLLKDIPKKIKNESLTQEENVTKTLYKDYASFRNEIFDAIQKENPEYDKLTLFKKTQKLLDRFLFIFFAEDRLLLPPNSIRSIVKQWTDLRDKYDEYFPLYDRFKKYFGYMNTGHKGQQHDIFAYNGGLFAPDDILDNIKINDDLLYKHTVKLSNYDFESEVSVNILGHIFEHSLNDIDEIQAEISNRIKANDELKSVEAANEFLPLDNKPIVISKRKKDGVFYTPKYITKYIVDNTVGKLCEEKKNELDIQEADYEKERKGRQKATLKKLTQKLEGYRSWLLQITICDPACGSGAFLNQALEFLIAEHQYIDELQAKLFGDAMILSEVENSILENNLFGVDINEESVEIAKLSLWLRTAQKGRKLTSLNNNIKCGNSLIDDPTVAGDKAFNWHTEFPNVFKENIKHAYHLVFTTHNSRTSKRMSALGLKKDPATDLNLTEEIALTKIFRDIILEYNYNIIAYNICKDHVHIILVCQPEKLSTIVKTLKGRSSYMFQSNGFKPIGKSLWSQKFFFAQLDEFVFADTAKAPGYVFNDHYLDTATNYIESNRSKHKLPQSDSLKNTIADFTKTKEEAFASEYTGGFDVVIGNPPYVQSLISEYEKEFFKNNYFSFEGKPDLYRLFIEKGIMLLRKGGLYSYITPNSFLTIPSAKKLRDFIKEHSSLVEIVNFEGMVFKDANINTVIFNISKLNSNKEIIIINDKTNVPSPSSLNYAISNNRNIINNTDYIKSNTINIENNYEIKSLTDKIKNNSIPLSDLSKYTLGLQVYHNTLHSKEDIKNRVYHNLKKQNDTYVPEIGGKNLDRYFISSKNTEFVSFGDWCYNRPDTFFLSGKRIFIREIPTSTHLIAGLFEKEGVPNKAIIIVKSETFNMYSLLGIINSKLIGFYVHKTTEKGKQKLFPRISLTSIKKLPITINTNSIFSCLVENQHIKVNTFQNRIDILLDLLKSKFNLTKPSKKLQNWYELDFGEFLKELEKARKKAHKSTSMDSSPLKKYNALTLSEEAEWMLYFNEQKQKATALKTEIDQTDKDIDQMVYELYGLTEDEIKIVEDTVKN